VKKYLLAALFALAAVTTAHAQAAKAGREAGRSSFAMDGAYAGATPAACGDPPRTIPIQCSCTRYHYPKGFVVGGQIGADWSMNNAVFGVGACWTMPISGAAPHAKPGDTCNTKFNYLSSVTARVGFGPGRSLFYAKGGVAFAGFSQTVVTNATGRHL